MTPGVSAETSMSLLQMVLAAGERKIDVDALRDHVRINGGTLLRAITECLRNRLTANQWIAQEMDRAENL